MIYSYLFLEAIVLCKLKGCIILIIRHYDFHWRERSLKCSLCLPQEINYIHTHSFLDLPADEKTLVANKNEQYRQKDDKRLLNNCAITISYTCNSVSFDREVEYKKQCQTEKTIHIHQSHTIIII